MALLDGMDPVIVVLLFICLVIGSFIAKVMYARWYFKKMSSTGTGMGPGWSIAGGSARDDAFENTSVPGSRLF